jgi:hypothetical protein
VAQISADSFSKSLDSSTIHFGSAWSHSFSFHVSCRAPWWIIIAIGATRRQTFKAWLQVMSKRRFDKNKHQKVILAGRTPPPP